jgi:phage-related holin
MERGTKRSKCKKGVVVKKLFFCQWLLKSVCGETLFLLTYLLGDLSKPVIIGIFIALALDWTTGLWKAAILKELSSKRLVQGAVKIVIYFILLIIIYQGKRIMPFIPILDSMIYAYIGITEGISICENLFVITSFYEIKLPVLNRIMDYLYIAKKELEIKKENGGVK